MSIPIPEPVPDPVVQPRADGVWGRFDDLQRGEAFLYPPPIASWWRSRRVR